MKLTIIGTGYVGLTTGTCFAEMGHEVICLDIDENKINSLNKGILPIYEPGLKELVDRNVREKRLKFTTDYKLAVHSSLVIFIAVGTPQDDEGRANLSYVFDAAKNIGKHMNEYKVIVDKSTVPVGTADTVRDIIKKETKNEFDVVSNPEFLREGSAIKDFMTADRVVIGVNSDKAKEIMVNIYKGLERVGKPIVITDIKSAELIKYASNAMLATRISFMNQLSHLCEKTGADIKEVAKGIGLDSRIGPRFLQAGVGYGGSCFPKDIKALTHTLKEHNCESSLFETVDKINEKQKHSIIPKIKSLVGDLKGKKIAIWGLAFKPKTDDIREAPSLAIIKELQKQGAKISAYDPVAEKEAQKILTNVEYTLNPLDTIKDADCLVIVTEWDEFRYLDKDKIKSLLKQPCVVDGRNIYDPKEMKELGFRYMGVGR